MEIPLFWWWVGEQKCIPITPIWIQWHRHMYTYSARDCQVQTHHFGVEEISPRQSRVCLKTNWEIRPMAPILDSKKNLEQNLGKLYIPQTVFYVLHLFLMSVTRMLETNGLSHFSYFGIHLPTQKWESSLQWSLGSLQTSNPAIWQFERTGQNRDHEWKVDQVD